MYHRNDSDLDLYVVLKNDVETREFDAEFAIPCIQKAGNDTVFRK